MEQLVARATRWSVGRSFWLVGNSVDPTTIESCIQQWFGKCQPG